MSRRDTGVKPLVLIVAALLLVVGGMALAQAREVGLPIVKPADLPETPGDIRNQITFQQMRQIDEAARDSAGLVIDLKDPELYGTIYSGPYPFEAGESDYDYARYRAVTKLKKGRGVIRIADFFKHQYDVNDWREGLSPATKTIGYRLDLSRGETAGCARPLGFHDSVVSFRKEGNAFVENLTIVEGPFVGMVTSDDPSSVTIAWETDEEANGTVSVYRVGGTAVQMKLGRKRYSLDEPKALSSNKMSTRHELALTGLEPRTDYLYVVESENKEGEKAQSWPYHFTTAPIKGEGSIRFAFASDSREGVGGGERTYMGSNFRVLSRIAEGAFREGAEFFLFGGDLVNGYTSEPEDFALQLKGWKQAMAGFWRSRPVYPCMGNHEVLSRHFDDGTRRGLALDRWPYETQSAEAIFAQEFFNPTNGPKPSDPRRPTYSENVFKFHYGPLLVIAFNNNYWWTTDRKVATYGGSPQGYLMEDQLQWIEHALKEAESDPKVKYVLLFAQEPVFPCGGHVKDAMWWYGNNSYRAYVFKEGKLEPSKLGIIEVRNRFWEAVSACSKVAAVMSGDEHEYHRTLITNKTTVGLFPEDAISGNDQVLDRYSPNPRFKHPTWHITAGTAGAPFYSREKTPWEPVILSSQQGYIMLAADGEKISMKFISITGQTVDEVDDLMAVKRVTPK